MADLTSSRESDLLYALLAARLGLIAESDLVDAARAAAQIPDRALSSVLESRKALSWEESTLLQSCVEALVKRKGSATEALKGFTAPRSLMLALGMGSDVGASGATLIAPSRHGSDPPSQITLTPRDGDGAKTVVMTQPSAAKYELGAEIGRGGIGRVVEARDADIDRQVALKLVLEDAPPEALERFRWEGRITGRLEHPHIVPVHDVGILPQTKEVYVAMKRIVGKDMHQVIKEGEWKLRRLVEAFRDVCRAVAYAHSKGVVHRDLKPANVMLGDFGEVLVVDWGLARLLAEPERRSKARPRSTTKKVRRGPMGGTSSKLTMEGQVLGTPSYMPPEQALGWLHEIDERSDVYSLGAILYEILARCAPYEDPNPWEVVRMVTTEDLKPPSIWVTCPPELEAICLKCLSKRKQDRYQSAGDVAAEVDSYLEGTKERERREKLADEQVAKAKAEIEKWSKLEAEGRETAEKARAMTEEVKAHAPVAKKRALWELQDRASALERQSLRAYAEAEAALTSALSNVPDHAAARTMKAEMAWTKLIEAEGSGDERSAILNRQVVERHDDGTYAERLKGDGTLAITTRAYPCRCLADGRSVRVANLNVGGYHAWSGRLLSLAGSEAMKGLETQRMMKLRVHAPSCKPAPLAGAKVWAFRFVELERALVPVTVGASKPKIPAEIIDQLFPDSPARPRGGGQYLGETPIPERSWPMGSWLLVITAEGREPLALPVAVSRQEKLAMGVTLFGAEEVPAGFVPVSAGPFAFGVKKLGVPSAADRKVDLDDYFIARQPVTCHDYARFLNDIEKELKGDSAKRAPRDGEAGPYWPLLDGKGWEVPTESWLGKAAAEARSLARRLRTSPLDWESQWPVMSISWEDAAAYARWAGRLDGRPYHLPIEEQWEKAARGLDGRRYPWGNHFDALRCNCTDSHADGFRPASNEAFPSDDSPYGVRNMAGNSRDWCLNEPGGRRYRDWRVARGGMWNAPAGSTPTTQRFGFPPNYLEPGQGFRLAAAVRLTTAEQAAKTAERDTAHGSDTSRS